MLFDRAERNVYHTDSSTSGFGMDLVQMPIVEGEPGLELHNLVTPEFGQYGSLADFDRRTVEEPLDEDPTKPILLLHRGEPASGKSVVLFQRIQYLLRDGGVIDQLVKNNGFEVRIDIIPWGDPFRVFKGGTTSNEQLKKLGLQEASLRHASTIYEFTLLGALAGYSPETEDFFNQLHFDTSMLGTPSLREGDSLLALKKKAEKEIHIIASDVPLLRADDVITRVLKREGFFGAIGDKFNTSYACINASNAVRNEAKRERRLEKDSINEGINRLMNEGVVVYLGDNDPIALINYVEECARLDDVLDMEKELNEELRKKAQEGLLPSRFSYVLRGHTWSATVDVLDVHPEGRAVLIGQEYLPKHLIFLEQSNGTVLSNSNVCKVSLRLDFDHHRPVLEMFREV